MSNIIEKRKLLFVGNGMATAHALRILVEEGAHERARITVLGDETAYDRIQLPKVLSGETPKSAIELLSRDWYAEHGINLHLGARAVRIDRAARMVLDNTGGRHDYDDLVLATGSAPVMPQVAGSDLDNVLVFRSQQDVSRMRELAEEDGAAIVVGGGLLGLEAAAGLAALGMPVHVVHLMPHLMERQLDFDGAALLRRELEGRGILTHVGTTLASIEGRGKVEAAILANGTRIPASLVVFAIGIRPEVSLAREAGLAIGRAIQVDDQLRSSDPAIRAMGECAEHQGVTYGLVAPAHEMAEVLARDLLGQEARYEGSNLATRLKVAGIGVFSTGEVEAREQDEVITLRDPANGIYRRLLLREGRMVGASLYGDVSDSAWFSRLCARGENVADLRRALPFGPDLSRAERLNPYGGLCSLAS